MKEMIHVVPEMIVKSYDGDSAIMSVGKSTNISHLKCSHFASDFSLHKSVVAE